MEIVKTLRKNRPRKILVYGVHGVGKSTFAASAPDAIFLQAEDGLGDIEANAFPMCYQWSEIVGIVNELSGSEEDDVPTLKLKTLVIDSLDKLEQLIWENICEQHNKPSMGDFDYGRGYVYALAVWNGFLTRLEEIQDIYDCNILMIAHSDIKKFEDPEGPSYDRYSPKLHKHASAVVQEWCDDVLFATYAAPITVKEEEGFGRKRTRVSAKGGNDRVLYTQDRPSRSAKTRCATMPEEIPLDWEAYSYFVSGGTVEIDVEEGDDNDEKATEAKQKVSKARRTTKKKAVNKRAANKKA